MHRHYLYCGRWRISGLGNGGPATAGKLSYPSGIAVDRTGNLYICDQANNMIRQVTSSGVIFTYAGTGIAGYTGDAEPQHSLHSVIEWCSRGHRK